MGYRLKTGEAVLFYAPDVATIVEQNAALDGVTLYIGDGASIARPLYDDVGISSAGMPPSLCSSSGVR